MSTLTLPARGDRDPRRPPWTSFRFRMVFVGVLSAAAWGGGCSPPEPVTWEAASVPVNGTEIHVVRGGNGPPLLVIHGGPMLDHGYLKASLASLADTREVILFDLRLNGRSAPQVDPASVRLDTLVADVEGVRAALGLEEVDVLAHSFGGLLGVLYAARWPERVRRLVLVSPMALSAALWQEEERTLASALTPEFQARQQELRAAPGVAAGEPAALEALLRHSFASQMADPSLAAELELYVPEDYLERSRQFAALGPDLQGFDFHEEAGRVEAPALILFGDREPGGELGGEALARALPRDSLVILPGVGHFSFLEAPERFRAEVRRWLEPS